VTKGAASVRVDSLGEDARSCFTDGSNCAESVLTALSSHPAVASLPTASGSGFTSGIGHSGCVCGALAASVMVLGAYAEGQECEPAARRELAEKLSAECAERFKEQWGATCCRTLKRGHTDGSDSAAAHCAKITEFSAALANEIIANQSGASTRRWAARDIVSAAYRISLDVLSALAVAAAAIVITDVVTGAVAAVELLLLAAVVAGAALGVFAEITDAARMAGRALRTLGIAAAGALALTSVVLPMAPMLVVEALLSPWSGPAGLLVRVILAVALALIAGLRIYGLKRFA
jgi:C_GCAxxG_C_C family probable redox protein